MKEVINLIEILITPLGTLFPLAIIRGDEETSKDDLLSDAFSKRDQVRASFKSTQKARALWRDPRNFSLIYSFPLAWCRERAHSFRG